MTILGDEAAKVTIGELFAKDPLELTDADVEQICNRLRKERETWETEEQSAKLAGRKPKQKVTLDSLDLDL